MSMIKFNYFTYCEYFHILKHIVRKYKSIYHVMHFEHSNFNRKGNNVTFVVIALDQ
jgi:hypothetical protein